MYADHRGVCWRWVVVTSLCAVFGFNALGGAGEESLDGVSVQVLIKQLGSDSRGERLGAERELIRRGTGVLEELPSPEEKFPVGVREALLRVRTEIEQRGAIESVRPSQVTVSGRMSLRKVLEEMERQTGNRLDTSGLTATELNEEREIELERETYWRAIEEVSRAFRVRLRTDAGKPLELVASATEDPPRTGTGQGVDLSSSVRVEWMGNEVREQTGVGEMVRARLQFVLEPRLRGLYGTFRPREFLLTTDRGTKLEPHDPGATFEIPCGEGGKVLEIGLDFDLPMNEQPRLLQLRGAGDLEIAAGEERFEFKRLGIREPQGMRKGNVAVTFETEPTEENDAKLKRFGILVRYDTAGPPFESHRLWIFHNRTFVTLENGQEILPAGYETVLQQGRIVGLKYDFPLTNEELRGAWFIYMAPTRIVSERVEFRFPAARISEGEISPAK
ncbi:MAG: hypothetical protein KDA68_05685 [Planctomycetaceae bacterium]|nr:hypothetical protein [Planctomycetaceae bacterium]